MKKLVELIILNTPDEYRKEFEENYANSSFTLRPNVPVVFVAEDFDHIFSEPGPEGTGRVFSLRRAKKMHFMKAILSNDIGTEIMLETESGNIAVFCDALDCVMYLRIRPPTGRLQVATFFDFGKDHTKMNKKQKKKCVPISDDELMNKVKNT